MPPLATPTGLESNTTPVEPVTRFARLRALILWVLGAAIFAVFLLQRDPVRLLEEADHLRFIAVPATLVAIAVLASVTLAIPRLLRLAPILFTLALTAGIVLNLDCRSDVDLPDEGAPFTPRRTRGLAGLGMRQGWFNHWTLGPLYTHLHDFHRGSTIVAYPNDKPVYLDYTTLVHPYMLEFVAEARYRVENYDYNLTPAQEEYLKARPHKELSDEYFTGLRWIVPLDAGPPAEALYVFKGATRHYLIRAGRLAEVRAR